MCGKLFVYVHVLSGGLFRDGLCNFADMSVNLQMLFSLSFPLQLSQM